MSIFNDSRRYSEDPDEYNEWKAEVAWQSRRDEGLELDFGYDEYEEYEEGEEE